VQGLLKDSSTQQGFIGRSILSCVSLGPGFLSSDTSEVCDKDACSAPCNVLLILSSQLRKSVCLTRHDAIKRELLLREGVRHVLNSRSLDFADQILALTERRGVDVVLNSLAGDFIPASLRSLANGGTFLELGKRDIWSSEAVSSIRPDVKFLAYDLGEEIRTDPNLFRDLMDELIVALSEETLRPLQLKLFPMERVRDAMRYMAQARHVGKIVLTTQAGRADPAPGGTAR